MHITGILLICLFPVNYNINTINKLTSSFMAAKKDFQFIVDFYNTNDLLFLS